MTKNGNKASKETRMYAHEAARGTRQAVVSRYHEEEEETNQAPMWSPHK